MARMGSLKRALRKWIIWGQPNLVDTEKQAEMEKNLPGTEKKGGGFLDIFACIKYLG